MLPRRPVTCCERLWDPASQEYKDSFQDMVDVIKRAALGRKGHDPSDPSLGGDFLTSWPLDLSNCSTSLHVVEFVEIILGAPANKRAGPDGIPAEFFKRFAKRLAPLFQEAWDELFYGSFPAPEILEARTWLVVPKIQGASTTEKLRDLELLNVTRKT